MADRELRITPHHKAYSRLRRVKDAFRFINTMAARGCAQLERTKARFVAQTYGVETNLIKRMKAKRRNELSFPEGGK